MFKKIIALSTVICMTAALGGCASDEEDSDTRIGGNFITGNKYECGDFRFTISGKYEEDYAADDKTSYKFTKGNDYDDPTIEIDSSVLFYTDLKPYADYAAENASFYSMNDDDIEITSTDIDTDMECGYLAAAVHFELDNDNGMSECYIANESRALKIKAQYKLSEKDSVRKDIEKLISSVEYISDFKLPTEDTDIDNEYFSVIVPKEWYCDHGYGGEGKAFIYYGNFGKTRISSVEEEATSIIMKVTEQDEESPEERASKVAERHADSEHYDKVKHFKYKMFGIETECEESFFVGSYSRTCYFDHNGLSWRVFFTYVNDDELADIEDMLGRIELK